MAFREQPNEPAPPSHLDRAAAMLATVNDARSLPIDYRLQLAQSYALVAIAEKLDALTTELLKPLDVPGLNRPTCPRCACEANEFGDCPKCFQPCVAP